MASLAELKAYGFSLAPLALSAKVLLQFNRHIYFKHILSLLARSEFNSTRAGPLLPLSQLLLALALILSGPYLHQSELFP